jgi:hypothetical protein
MQTPNSWWIVTSCMKPMYRTSTISWDFKT